MTKLAAVKIRRLAAPALLAVIVFCAPACCVAQAVAHDARDITGQWQGTLELPHPLRIVLKVAKAPDGTLTALNYSIDQSPQPAKTSGVMLDGHTFKYAIPAYGAAYEGQLSADGNTIAGKWAGNTTLNFTRATKEAAWEIPAPPPPLKPMTEPNPSFQVATIKPTDPDKPGKYIRVMGRIYTTHGTSLTDLIQVAYGVNPKQIAGAPAWVHDDKFDLAAIPDAEGEPSARQWLTMMQKLLADRFGLVFHRDKQEISSFVLTVAGGGEKNLTPSQSNAQLPSGLEFRPVPGGLLLPARNTTMGQLTQMLQQVVLDRPVVDLTGLTGRYDFDLTFMPDETQFNGHPPVAPSQAENTAPGLSEAFQKQLGLKLTLEKIPTDILVIDHVAKPSAN
ncbi:MAG TPA: TIGR03435 family protein [Acidobacteriaceae bacterium]